MILPRRVSPLMSAVCPPATNFYQLPVQTSVSSARHVNTAVRTSSHNTSPTATILSFTRRFSGAALQDRRSIVCRAAKQNNQSHDDRRTEINTPPTPYFATLIEGSLCDRRGDTKPHQRPQMPRVIVQAGGNGCASFRRP